ncbi:Protein CBG26045 [Caenorhabditis briggsae]|uniref:Protein CBG26045 n=1 Tax=Caenorhabditis briggsae TaxID=6238 RepID=B6IHD6_CAEBR|nr:Protein CBG26045 [Caenorhabditis briggsae]CAR99316.1 Protein CBG26045 [Caenorhabditis briggsae]
MTTNEFLETLGEIAHFQHLPLPGGTPINPEAILEGFREPQVHLGKTRLAHALPMSCRFFKTIANLQHLTLFFLIRWLQEHYGMEYAPQHVPFLLMGSANALIGLLGSTQCFDVIVIVELVMATMFAFLFRFFLFFPVIAAMMVQTSRRLEKILINPLEESGNREEEAPPTRPSARSHIKKRLESFRRRRQECVNETSSDNVE